jgi:hypothetical protein
LAGGLKYLRRGGRSTPEGLLEYLGRGLEYLGRVGVPWPGGWSTRVGGLEYLVGTDRNEFWNTSEGGLEYLGSGVGVPWQRGAGTWRGLEYLGRGVGVPAREINN